MPILHERLVNRPFANNFSQLASARHANGHPMTPTRRLELFRRLQAANPEPQSELTHSTPFELLVAVVLSAQATDKSVNKATAVLFPKANTPRAILKLGVPG